jgi:hypothetical protein
MSAAVHLRESSTAVYVMVPWVLWYGDVSWILIWSRIAEALSCHS